MHHRRTNRCHGRLLCAALIASAAVGSSRSAHAEDKQKPHTEIGGVPLLGGDSDLGFGGGGFGSIARFEPGYAPYRFRIEMAGAITFRPSEDGLQLPYQDLYALLTMPQLASKRLRLEARISYTRETTLNYYGIGNAVPAPERGPNGQSQQAYFQYGLTHPSLSLRVRLQLTNAWSIQLGSVTTYQSPQIRSGSLLAQQSRDRSLSRFFGPLEAHFVQLLEYTLLYDTRDNETSTLAGMFHQLKLRFSPGGVEPLPYRYGQVNLTLRFYKTFSRFTFAGRVVGDLLYGDAPFYELPRYEDTFAIGGANGVRGVPAQRYGGKLKAFGNLELRVQVLKFGLFGLPCMLSTVGFFDAGRLWSDFHSNEKLDGTALGLKLGVGGGLRLQQGQAFVVRADIAWSPDAKPLGAYVIAGQVF